MVFQMNRQALHKKTTTKLTYSRIGTTNRESWQSMHILSVSNDTGLLAKGRDETRLTDQACQLFREFTIGISKEAWRCAEMLFKLSLRAPQVLNDSGSPFTFAF